jgi:CheY-like chemotaxis protein
LTAFIDRVSRRPARPPGMLKDVLWLAGIGDPDPAPGEERPLPGSELPGAQAALRVLVIEDNVDAADSLRDYLELGGHEVLVAYTGPEGVEAAARFLPNIVVCDIGLPGMSGWEVARAIRSGASGPPPRLIAITGYGTDEDRRRSTEAGFEVHLTKPIDVSVLDSLLGPLA